MWKTIKLETYLTDQLFQLEKSLFGNKISHQIEYHSCLSQSIFLSNEKFLKGYGLLLFTGEILHLILGVNHPGPAFAYIVSLNSNFLKVLLTFFSELQHYNLSYSKFLIFFNGTQQSTKESKDSVI